MGRQRHSIARCNGRKRKCLRPAWQKVRAVCPGQVVRQPNWGFQDQRLTRKSGDWESTNIGSKFNVRTDPSLPAQSYRVCALNSIYSNLSITRAPKRGQAKEL